MSKRNETTQAVEGSYVEFQAAVLRALPRDIDSETRLNLTRNGESLIRVLREALMPIVVAKKNNKFIKLISGNEILTIDACDGNEILANAKDTFAYIDMDFRNWKADEKGQTTKETQINVYELTKNATFSQMFGSASADLNKLCLTQSQIKSFVKKHKKWLRKDGYATFFLFKSYGHFFVARLPFYSGSGLDVYVLRLENDYVWNAEYRSRVVLPQLA